MASLNDKSDASFRLRIRIRNLLTQSESIDWEKVETIVDSCTENLNGLVHIIWSVAVPLYIFSKRLSNLIRTVGVKDKQD